MYQTEGLGFNGGVYLKNTQTNKTATLSVVLISGSVGWKDQFESCDAFFQKKERILQHSECHLPSGKVLHHLELITN